MEAGPIEVIGWLPVATFVLGVFVTFGLEAVRRRWAREDSSEALARASEAERKGRVEVRARQAAEELIRTFGELRTRSRQFVPDDDLDIPDAKVGAIQREAVYLTDPELRTRIDKIGEVYLFLDVAGFPTPTEENPSPRTFVVFVTAYWALEALGAMLREESIPDADAIEPFFRQMDDF